MLKTNPRTASARVAPILLFALVVMLTPSALAQSYTVLHNFTGGADGANSYAGLTADRAGNFYGTAASGGNMGPYCGIGCGTVFKLTRAGANWVLNPLYAFQASENGDGSGPLARVIFGPDGALYGTTAAGGQGAGDGTVFRLTPPATACKTVLCPWTETILHSFQGGNNDGSGPRYGDLAFDGAGDLYGTTIYGGPGSDGCNYFGNCGTVYEVAHQNGDWNESVIWYFAEGIILGFWPYNGVTLDSAGNVYGAVTWGGEIYELTPGQGGSGWSATILYDFAIHQLGCPVGGLIFDHAGNLYGTSACDGSGGGGSVFELSTSGDGWTLTTLYSFNYSGSNEMPGPSSTLTMDASGALYGNTYAEGAYGYGSIFKLTPSQGSWTYTSLHDFTGGSDGGYPWGQVILDANGNVYGTTTVGGSTVGSCYQNQGCGVVFEITP
jgi:uncharacterized repeat protein (TIGR03803 family)